MIALLYAVMIDLVLLMVYDFEFQGFFCTKINFIELFVFTFNDFFELKPSSNFFLKNSLNLFDYETSYEQSTYFFFFLYYLFSLYELCNHAKYHINERVSYS
jgi:hypothetical protein